MTSFVNPAKLKQPKLRNNAIIRNKVFSRFDPDKKLTTLVAPAGYGKTTAINLLLNNYKVKHSCWINLDERDTYFDSFIKSLSYAIEKIAPQTESIFKTHLPHQIARNEESITTAFVTSFELIDHTLYIILDDFQWIKEEDALYFMEDLISYTPEHIHFILASRSPIPMSLSSFRLADEITELTDEDLRFSTEEARLFFQNTMAMNISEEQVEKLFFKTEGWVAGLQMACISLSTSSDKETFVEQFTGSNRLITDYLLDEVLASLPSPLIHFLFVTSIPNRFDEELCSYLFEGDNIATLLQQVESNQLFLIRSEGFPIEYRYHQMFGEFLRRTFAQKQPLVFKETLDRLIQYYQTKNKYEAALEYALKHDSHSTALAILNESALEYFMQTSDLRTFETYESKIPDSEKYNYPSLLTAKAWRCFALMDIIRVEQLVDQASRANITNTNPNEQQIVNEHLLVIQTFLLRFKGDFSAAIEQIQSALPLLVSDYTKGLLYYNLQQCYLRRGSFSQAESIYPQAYHYNAKSGNIYTLMMSLSASAYMMFEQLAFYAAERRIKEALEIAAKYQMLHITPVGRLFLVQSMIDYQRDNLASAKENIDKAIEYSKRGNDLLLYANSILVKALILSAEGNPSDGLIWYKYAEDKLNGMTIYDGAELTKPLNIFCRMALGLPVDVRISELTESPTLASVYEHIYALNQLSTDYQQTKIVSTVAELAEKGANLFGECELLRAHLVTYKLLFGIELTKDDEYVLTRIKEEGAVRIVLDKRNSGNLMQHPSWNLIPTESKLFFTNLLQPKPTFTQKFKQALLEPLTEREQEVLYYISKELNNRQIADKMYVSYNTIKTHIKNLYGKLGVSDREEALVVARGKKLIPQD